VLEGTFRGHLAQPPCSDQGHLQLDHIAKRLKSLEIYSMAQHCPLSAVYVLNTLTAAVFITRVVQ